MLQDVHALFIGKGNIVEIDPALHIGQNQAALLILDGHRVVDGVKNPLQVCADLGQMLDDDGNHGQRCGELGHISGESGKQTHIHRRVAGFEHTEGHTVQAQNTRIPEHLDDGGVQLVAHIDLFPVNQSIVMDLSVDLLVEQAPVIALDDFLAHDGFHQEGGPVGVLGNVDGEQLADGIAQGEDADHQRNHRSKDDQRQLRAEGQHKHGDHNNLNDVDHEHHHEVREEMGQVIDILRDTDYNLAVGPVVKVFKGQFLELVENIPPDVGNHRMTGFAHNPGVNEADADFHSRQSHHAQHHVSQLGIVPVGNHPVGDVLQHQGRHHSHQGREEHQAQHQKKDFLIGQNIAQSLDQLF